MDDGDRISVACGADEVGRGAVFGPLVVAAVANPRGWFHDQVKDSKKYSSEAKRYRVAQEVMRNTVWSMAEVPVGYINSAGINRCVRHAFQAVIRKLAQVVAGQVDRPPHLTVVVDGSDLQDSDTVLDIHGRSTRITVRCEPKADANHFETSAASVIAKAYRDAQMVRMVQRQPDLARYQIDRNMGYGTPGHAAALAAHGLTPHHRVQFSESLIRSHLQKYGPQTVQGTFADLSFDYQPGVKQ